MAKVTPNIAKQIKKYRENMGLTKKELAEMVGTAPSTVSGWESADYAPGADTLVKLCDIFNITLDEIFGIDNKKLAATNDNELDGEVLSLIKHLSPGELDQAKRFLRFLADSAGNKEK